MLLTSSYAIGETRRNLRKYRQHEDLAELLASVSVVEASADPQLHPALETVQLPEKDTPILLAAVGAEATHLITGDFTHFGPYYGQKIGGVMVRSPAGYLREYASRKKRDV